MSENENQMYTFPCKSCGGDMKFSPSESSLKCPYCGEENEIPKEDSFETKENDYAAILDSLENECEHEDIESLTCEACGAEVSLEGNTAATECPYCGTSIVSEKHSHNTIKPSYLLPFAVGHDKAVTNFKDWLNSRWFLPSDVKTMASRDKLQGVYSPYWTYDSMTATSYTGQRGTHYTVTEHYTEKDSEGKTVSKTRQVTKTRWTWVSGYVSRHFDDVLVIGSDKLPRKYTRELEPWDLDNLVEFDHSYLSGFMSETYSIGLKDGFETAKELMYPHIENDIERDIGGDEQRINYRSTNYSDIKFKHILLPIWVSSFKYNDKVYNFLVNARTGEVQGERPWSAIKITIFVLSILVVIAALIAVFMMVSK